MELQSLALLSPAFLAGCITIGTVDGTRVAPKSNVGYYVLGVKPEDTWISIFPGEVKDGKMDFSDVSRVVFNGPASKGYVVARIEAERALGIMIVRLEKGGNYTACGGGRTAVFYPATGKTLYFGEIAHEESTTGLITHRTSDFRSAVEFLEREYPGLANNVTDAQYEVVPVRDVCRGFDAGRFAQ